VYPSVEARDTAMASDMEYGIIEGYERLDELLGRCVPAEPHSRGHLAANIGALKVLNGRRGSPGGVKQVGEIARSIAFGQSAGDGQAAGRVSA
jgi:hypothetical protein